MVQKLDYRKTTSHLSSNQSIKNTKTSSIKLIEIELGIPQTTVYRILTAVLGIIRLIRGWFHTNSPKILQRHHDKYSERPKLLEKIVTGDKTWCFEYKPEAKRQSVEWIKENKKKVVKKIKSEISLYDSKGIIHKESVKPGQTITEEFYLGVS